MCSAEMALLATELTSIGADAWAHVRERSHGRNGNMLYWLHRDDTSYAMISVTLGFVDVTLRRGGIMVVYDAGRSLKDIRPEMLKQLRDFIEDPARL